jgi:glycosyltransferase involved in cell wall biosynthesis
MNEGPRVSVLIPCFDLGSTLEEAVQSVLGQGYRDHEILIVDDGSADRQTVAILDRAAWPGTRVFRRPHAGLAAARNFALSQARGTYVCALDADDRLDPAFLEKTVRVLETDPETTFVSCWLDAFGEREWRWTPEECDLPALLAQVTVATCALVRRQAVLDVGGYDGQMPHQGYEDWDLWISLVERGHRGVILPEVLFHYRQRAGSMAQHCVFGEPHVELMRYLIHKHEPSYRRHREEVLRRKDQEIAGLLRENRRLEDEIGRRVLPELEARKAERARLEAKRARCLRERAREERVAALEAEVAALRASKSWQITAPLRAAYDLWLRRKGAR